MPTKTTTILAVAVMIAVGAPPLDAQGPRGGGQGFRSNVAERALALREHLELSDEQIASLDQFREELLQQRLADLGELMRIRSDVAAGELTRADARERIAAQREEAQTGVTARQDRLSEILSEEQLGQFRESQTRGRRGRAQFRRNRGDRGPGFRGRRGGFRSGVS